MSMFPRVFRAITDYPPLGILAGDVIWYDLTQPSPIRIVRVLPYDHGLMLGAELDGAIEPCSGAILPSHGLGLPHLHRQSSEPPALALIRLVK